MQKKMVLNRKNLMIGTAGLIFLIAAGWWMSLSGAEEAVLFKTDHERIQEFVEIRGIVELNNEETVASQIPGVVREIRVAEGDQILPGTLLAYLDPREYQLELERAKSTYVGARAAMEDLKQSIKPEAIHQAELQREQADIAVEAAKKNLIYQRDRTDQVRELFKEGAVSKQYVKDMESQETMAEDSLRDAERRLQIAQKSVDLLKKGVSKEAVATARAQVDQAEVQIAEARRMLQKVDVIAGLGGTILTKHTETGAVVTPGTPLFTIGDSKTAYIRVDVLVDDAENVRLGQRVRITGEVLGESSMTGTIDYIAPKAENKISSLGIEQQRIEMRIALPKLGVLRPGYGVDVKIVTDERTQVVTVPEKAVFEWKGRDHVFVVRGGKLVLLPVTLGLENDDKIQIVSGLIKGEVVVDDPEKKLKPGMRVKAKEQED